MGISRISRDFQDFQGSPGFPGFPGISRIPRISNDFQGFPRFPRLPGISRSSQDFPDFVGCPGFSGISRISRDFQDLIMSHLAMSKPLFSKICIFRVIESAENDNRRTNCSFRICWWGSWVLVTAEVTRHMTDDLGKHVVPRRFQSFQEPSGPGKALF